MGNCCYADALAYEEYKKALNQDSSSRLKNFIWGSGPTIISFMYFVDIKNQRFHPLKTPGDIVLYNIAGSCQYNDNQIAICGGVTYQIDMVSKTFLIYNIHQNTYQKMPPMFTSRFNFPLIYLDDVLYAIGGRTYGETAASLLNKCEAFSFKTGKWKKIASLHHGRGGAQACIYKQQIWIIGGLNSSHHGKIIEYYNPLADAWTIVNAKLPFDYFNSGCLPDVSQPDSILIFGGANRLGVSAAIHSLNLKTQRIINRGCFKEKRAGFKYFSNAQLTEMIVVGGFLDQNNHRLIFAEHFSFENPQLNNYISFPIIFEGDLEMKMVMFNQSHIPVVIQASNDFDLPVELRDSFDVPQCLDRPRLSSVKFLGIAKERQRSNSEKVFAVKSSSAILETPSLANNHYIFGTDNEPFMIRIEPEREEVELKEVPWSLKLRNH